MLYPPLIVPQVVSCIPGLIPGVKKNVKVEKYNSSTTIPQTLQVKARVQRTLFSPQSQVQQHLLCNEYNILKVRHPREIVCDDVMYFGGLLF